MARTLDRDAQDSHRQSEDQRCCTLYADDPNVYSVDKILDIRVVTNKIEYLVACTGYPAQYNQWLSEKDVTPDLTRAYSRANKERVIKRLKRKQTLSNEPKQLKYEDDTVSDQLKAEFDSDSETY